MTSEQAATKDGFERVAIDVIELRKFTNVVNGIADVILYSSTRNTLMTASGRCFIHKPNSTATVDNVMTLPASGKGGGRWEAIYSGAVDLAWFGAKGDGVQDDTAAVQSAINYVLNAANPVLGQTPTYNGNSGTLLVPVGTYRIGNIQVNGSVRIIGQGGGTYAGSTFVQSQDGVSMFLLNAAQDGSSNSTLFENIFFKSGSATSNNNVAQVKTANGISSNSVYFRNCWFKTPENYAIWLTQGDDIQIANCTFDVCPFHAIKLGTQGGGMVTNATIINNTFYQISLNHIKLENVQGVVISGNRAYNNDGAGIATAVFVNGLSATNINGLTLSGNEYNNVPNFALLPTNTRALVIAGNTGYKTDGYFLNLAGGGILYGASIVGNACFAIGAWSSGPIAGVGCGVQGSIITGNSFFANSPTALGINLSDARVTGNQINNNGFIGFIAVDNLVSPYSNGRALPIDSTMNPAVGDVLKYGASGWKNYSAIAYTANYNTTGWTIGAYNNLLPTNTIGEGVYQVILRFSKAGLEEILQVFTVPIIATSSGATAIAGTLTGQTIAYTNSNRAFTLKYVNGTAFYGLAGAINTADMAGGTLSITVIKM